ncbi:Mak10-domain-containing protein [Violaceomyces palustris]|uniref:Mak10-domain-containing protein n=1 Tax=Violaceomyces palustris TaxID=1673888 RepID=A0ACD0NMT2_9BASI|nr:Mak10-domain-containing protein [Violaceomyces palustris]
MSTAMTGPSSAPVLPTKISLPGFHDATQELRDACASLSLGEMVHTRGFTLLDSMMAIQIMDPRMDSGMELPVSELPEADRLPNDTPRQEFDPFQPLEPQDVAWIMDRLLACEVAFQRGSTLSQTLYTCLYFHSTNALNEKDPKFLSRVESSPPYQLTTKVLRSYILATTKVCETIWKEMIKQNIYDGEDFAGDKSGLSLLEGMEAGYAINQLDEAIQWLSQTETINARWKESLKARISFKKNLLQSLSLVEGFDSDLLLEVPLHVRFARRHLDLLRCVRLDPVATSRHSFENSQPLESFMDPGRAKAPSNRSVAAFDPAYNRRLSTSAPLRPIALPSPDEIWDFYHRFLTDLLEVVSMIQRPSVLSWKMLLSQKASTFQKMNTAAYIRSLTQSAICDQNRVAGRLSLEWLTECLFLEVGMIEPSFLRQAARIGRTEVEGGSQRAWDRPPSLGQSISFFSQRVSGYLVNYLSTFAQNRSRQKRNLSKVYGQWVTLAEEAAELGNRLESVVRPEDYMPDSIFACVQHLALSVMSEIVLSGFDLELYRRDEWIAMYWCAAKITSEQAIVCADLAHHLKERFRKAGGSELSFERSVEYLLSQVEMAKALEEMCYSSIALLRIQPRKEPNPTPWNERSAASEMELKRSTFLRRLKWIEIGGRKGSAEQVQALWNEFSDFNDDLCKADRHELIERSSTGFKRALEIYESLASRPKEETRTELCDLAHRKSPPRIDNPGVDPRSTMR